MFGFPDFQYMPSIKNAGSCCWSESCNPLYNGPCAPAAAGTSRAIMCYCPAIDLGIVGLGSRACCG